MKKKKILMQFVFVQCNNMNKYANLLIIIN